MDAYSETAHFPSVKALTKILLFNIRKLEEKIIFHHIMTEVPRATQKGCRLPLENQQEARHCQLTLDQRFFSRRFV